MSGIEEPNEVWNLWTRVAFRFVVVATIVFSIFRFLRDLLERLPLPLQWGVRWSDAVAPVWSWFARATRALLLVPRPPRVSVGRWAFTGPTNLILIDLASVALCAAVVTLVWSYLDRRRPNYRNLHEGLRVYFRFSLAVILISYGVFKLLLNQGDFPPLPSSMLLPWGNVSVQMIPIQMLGPSPVYQVFAGAVEFVAGVVLVFRRTARVGAFVAIAAATNVAALNIGYHMWGMSVLSITMLVMAGVLAAPDLPWLADLLVLGRSVPFLRTRPLYRNRRFSRVAQVCGLIFLAGELGSRFHQGLTTGMHWRGRPPLYGAYDVETFVRGRDTIPPFPMDSTRWLQFAVDPSSDPLMRTGNAYATIFFARRTTPIALRIDTATKTIKGLSFMPRERPSDWTYSMPDAEHVVLRLANQQSTAAPARTEPSGVTEITLHRIDLNAMPMLQSQRTPR